LQRRRLVFLSLASALFPFENAGIILFFYDGNLPVSLIDSAAQVAGELRAFCLRRSGSDDDDDDGDCGDVAVDFDACRRRCRRQMPPVAGAATATPRPLQLASGMA